MKKTLTPSSILEYQNAGVITRYMKDNNVSYEVAEQIFMEMVKFLYIAGTNRGQSFTPSKQIDEMWHTFILFTKEYAEFYQEYFGFFIHHTPNDSIKYGAKSTSTTYQETNKMMRKVFGGKFAMVLASNECAAGGGGDSACDSDSSGSGGPCGSYD